MRKMKINYEGREKLRNELRTLILESAPLISKTMDESGYRIKIDKDILETILFEEVVINPSVGIKVKLPVFSGRFLKRIDLSEISFEDVSWGLLGKDDFDHFSILNNLILASGANKEAMEQVKKIRDSYNGNPIQYIRTNAVIDFSKSFEAKRGHCVNISHCYFDKENVKPNSFDRITNINITHSDVSCIPIPKGVKLTAFHSNLSRIDLSWMTIDAHDYIKGSPESLGMCELCETGISIKLVPSKFQQAIEDEKSHEYDLQDLWDFRWLGCYVNNKLVRSAEEHAAKQAELRYAYEQYEQGYIGNILESVKGQIHGQK